MPSVPLMAIVDDDDALRNSLDNLLRSVGFRVQGFASAEAFLQAQHAPETACLLLDVRLPGMNGLELQRQLGVTHRRIPTIFITAQCDRSLEARLIARGAIACLFKPFGDTELFNALTAAMGGSDDVVGPKR